LVGRQLGELDAALPHGADKQSIVDKSAQVLSKNLEGYLILIA
jgi:hypothetical protein